MRKNVLIDIELTAEEIATEAHTLGTLDKLIIMRVMARNFFDKELLELANDLPAGLTEFAAGFQAFAEQLHKISQSVAK